MSRLNLKINFLLLSLFIFTLGLGVCFSAQGISPIEPRASSYAPGELIVKLKQGKTLTDIQDLNAAYQVRATEKVFKDTASPQETFKQRKDKLAELSAEHEKWFWQLDKSSQEYKDYIKKIEAEKEILTRQIQAQEALIRRLEQRQKRAPEGATPPDLDNIYLLRTKAEIDVLQMVVAYKSNPAIEYAQPNYMMKIQMFPTDPYYYTYSSWGQGYADLWGLKKINCQQAWDTSQGEGVIVAVIDSGIDYNHPDLKDNIWENSGDLEHPGEIPNNGIDDDGNGYVDDFRGFDFANSRDLNGDGDYNDAGEINDPDPLDGFGHGTHVAGVIAAVGNNGIGVIGVAPKAKLMALKVLDDKEGAGFALDCVRALKYAADNGADVLNNSWGPEGRLPSNPVIEAAVADAYAKGCVIVFAAGNDNDDVAYYSPANSPLVLTVAASDQNDQKCYFSNWGAKIDVAGPGGYMNILSTMPDTSQMARLYPSLKVSNGYWRLQGTSLSTPYVSGLAALLIAKYPLLSVEDVRKIMYGSSDDSWQLPGKDSYFGYGRINASVALNEFPPPLIRDIDGDGIVRVFLHFLQKPDANLLQEIRDLGFTVYEGSWIPPVGPSPTGFLLASIPKIQLNNLNFNILKGALREVKVIDIVSAETKSYPLPDEPPLALMVGDVKTDGKVTIADALFIAQYAHVPRLRELDSAQLQAADVNYDGNVTLDDAKRIAEYLAGLISSLEVGPSINVFLHFTQYPQVTALQSLSDFGFTIYEDSWVPPLGSFPTGFFIASITSEKVVNVQDYTTNETLSSMGVVNLVRGNRLAHPLQ